MKSILGRPSTLNHPWTIRALLLLSVSISLVYSNCLEAIWTVDDDPNIIQNTQLHIKDLHPETLFQTFFSPLHPDANGNPGLNRPLANLSFALNWYLGEDSPVGYRVFNIFIHCLTAFVLFLVTRALLDTPNLHGKYRDVQNQIALLAAALWALNPIQTQAVVYIVQRMASLAAFFYLLAIWCYLRAKASESSCRRMLFLFGTAASFSAAVGSKENAVLLPAALVLVEAVFFQGKISLHPRRRFCYFLALSLALLFIGGVALFSAGKLDNLLDYSIRLFTPWERLLTEPRVVLYYLSQIFFPLPGRLSIVHDVQISRTLLAPWTTLPAILGVLALICFGIWQMRKHPMLSFAILFFFLNHVIESSIIGLELIYEHRNYLPSLFLFVPVAIGLQCCTRHYRIRNYSFQRMALTFIFLIVVGFGAGTYIRNQAWSDHKTFWEDAAAKAPLSMRPVHNLAYYHYEKRGEYEKAFELYHKALELEDNNRLILSLPHAKIAEYYERWRAFEKAAEHLDRALAIFPGFEGLNYRLADMLARAGNLERALTTIRPLVVKYPNSFSCNYLVARILLKMSDIEGALCHLRRCLSISPYSAKTFLLMGIALNRQGDWLTAEKFLQAVLDRYPNDKLALLWMIDCQLRRSDDIAAAGLASRFIEGVPLDQINHFIENALDDDFMAEGSRERLAYWITTQAKSLDSGKRDASISGNDGPSKQRHGL